MEALLDHLDLMERKHIPKEYQWVMVFLILCKIYRNNLAVQASSYVPPVEAHTHGNDSEGDEDKTQSSMSSVPPSPKEEEERGQSASPSSSGSSNSADGDGSGSTSSGSSGSTETTEEETSSFTSLKENEMPSDVSFSSMASPKKKCANSGGSSKNNSPAPSEKKSDANDKKVCSVLTFCALIMCFRVMMMMLVNIARKDPLPRTNWYPTNIKSIALWLIIVLEALCPG